MYLGTNRETKRIKSDINMLFFVLRRPQEHFITEKKKRFQG